MPYEQLTQTGQMLENNKSELDDKWLTFWTDNQLFSVSIASVEQIVSMQPITEVPEYPSYAKGIINLRGNIIPLVDLRLRLGKEAIPYADHTCIIISNVADRLLGFVVDSVDSVINIDPSSISPPPKLGEDASSRYVTGVAHIESGNNTEKIVLCLDAMAILQQDEFERLCSESN